MGDRGTRLRERERELTLFKVAFATRRAFGPGVLYRSGSMARRTVLPETEIARRLREVRRWKREENTITRTWAFRDFPAALAFINRVGELAETANHHPEIHNSWTTVTLSLTTHDAGGLTERDFDLAKKIDALALDRA